MKCSNCCGLAHAIRICAEKSRNPAKITNSRCTAADFGGHRCVKLSVLKKQYVCVRWIMKRCKCSRGRGKGEWYTESWKIWNKETERGSVSRINDMFVGEDARGRGDGSDLCQIWQIQRAITLSLLAQTWTQKWRNLPEKWPTLRNQIYSYLSSCCHCMFLRMWSLYLKLLRPVPLLCERAGWLWRIKATRYVAITFRGWQEARQRGESWGKRGTETETTTDGWWDTSGVTVPARVPQVNTWGDSMH